MHTPTLAAREAQLLRRGRGLEAATFAWNAAGLVVLAVAAIGAQSVALAGFGLDSLIEIGASTVVLWELSGTGAHRQRRALRLIAAAFLTLAGYLTVQTAIVLVAGYHPQHSSLGIVWTALTAAVMFALAAAVLAGLILNAAFGWWWADPAAGLVIIYYAIKEARTIRADLARR